MKRLLVMCCSASLVITAAGMAAQAMPLYLPTGLASPSSNPAKAGYICGPGFHLGPHGKYCWPNGHYAVPPGYGMPCPPHYHLGPKGHECWPNH
jgi:hypothetical protein